MPRLLHGGLFALLLGIGVCVVVPQLPAQKAGPESEDLSPKSAKDGLPFYTEPDPRALKNLGTATRSLSRAVMVVGYPKGRHGTAWVLSAKHRLLVTNAHVADLLGEAGKMLAIVNGTEQDHKVERVWYHPGVRRKLPGGKISIRSECPADGEVFTVSPDLAVLQLAPDGPALTAEFPMATPDELNNLFAQTVGMLGYPAHDTTSFPDRGEKAQGTYHDGVISRLTNFRLSVNAPAEDLQFVQHTIQNFGGFSGSPIYLSNGHVVAINNSGGPREDRGMTVVISYGIRVDCLWELLVHHGLDSKVPVPVDKSQLRIQRWLELSEAEKQFRHAVKLVDEAAYLIDVRQEFLAGVKKCTEAIAIAPEYPDAYRVRCAGRNNCYCYERPPTEKARAILKAAMEDAEKYAKLMSSDPRWLTAEVNTAINVVALTRNSSPVKPYLSKLDKALSIANIPKPQRAEFYSLRGMCHFNLRNRASAEDDFNASIRLDPQNDALFDNRAQFWQAIGRKELAETDRVRARALRKGILEKAKEID